MNRREFLGWTAVGLAANGTARTAEPPTGETLPNGIRLSEPWPPRLSEVPRDPVPPPYPAAPPAVIPIDRGRQLFVDDFLIAQTTLQRTFHAPQSHPGNPILRPDKPWEQKGRGPMAMVFSDGVWYDPRDRLFKMWYMGGYGLSTCYAFSEDGLRWTKPALDVVKGTNIVHPHGRDSTTLWLDLEAKEPQRRYTLLRSHSEDRKWGLSIHFSADGIHWGERAVRTAPAGDRTTFFWNPFRKRWIYSLRGGKGPRHRRYWESADLVKGPAWTQLDEAPIWIGSDRLDPPRDDLKVVPQLYNLDAVAYESLLLGLFTIWRGDLNIPPGRPKPNELCVGFSRDGFHWHRPERRPFIAVSERKGDWNWGNVQSAGGCCLVVGDKLYFYYSGRAGTPAKKDTRDGGGSTGLAVLRRDGFASMDAGDSEGTLTTRPVRFTGRHLFVNVDAPKGQLTAEVLDPDGRRVLEGLARADCLPVHGDQTRQVVRWKKADLSAAAGKPVRFRFHLKGGKLYAFWVSAQPGGASGGYVAAGGPAFTGSADGR